MTDYNADERARELYCSRAGIPEIASSLRAAYAAGEQRAYERAIEAMNGLADERFDGDDDDSAIMFDEAIDAIRALALKART